MSESAEIALVTGGNRGLGLETCRQLASRGLHVVLTSRGPDGHDAARRLAADGLDVRHVLLDVADPASATSLPDRLGPDDRPIDVLVANAGVSMSGFDGRVARGTLEVNTFGAERVTMALLPHLRDGARILMVSSGLGELSALAPALRDELLDPALTRDGLDRLMRSFIDAVNHGRHAAEGWPSSAYRVSKAGLNALTRILARELAGRRITVNAVCPGWVRTDMGGSAAPRSVEVGAASIVAGAFLPPGTTGGLFRDGQPVGW